MWLLEIALEKQKLDENFNFHKQDIIDFTKFKNQPCEGPQKEKPFLQFRTVFDNKEITKSQHCTMEFYEFLSIKNKLKIYDIVQAQCSAHSQFCWIIHSDFYYNCAQMPTVHWKRDK